MNKIQIHENAISKSKAFKKSELELLEALDLVDKNRVYLNYKSRSLFHYCQEHLGLSEDVAMNFIRVMRKSREVPELKQAIEAQKLTVSKARRIVPILNNKNQELWINEAVVCSSHKLQEKIAAYFPESIKKETVRVVSDEYVCISIRVKKSDFQKIKRAQELKSRKVKRLASIEETIVDSASEYVQKYDPVEKALRKSKKKILAQVPKQKLPGSEQVKIPTDQITNKKLPGLVQVKSVQRIPAASLHVVNQRDFGQCQEVNGKGEKCLSGQFTEIHHIVHRSKGGSHDPGNLITLCSGHHKAQHFSENV